MIRHKKRLAVCRCGRTCAWALSLPAPRNLRARKMCATHFLPPIPNAKNILCSVPRRWGNSARRAERMRCALMASRRLPMRGLSKLDTAALSHTPRDDITTRGTNQMITIHREAVCNGRQGVNYTMNTRAQKIRARGLRVRARVRAGYDMPPVPGMPPGPCLLGQCPGPTGYECDIQCMNLRTREELNQCLKNCYPSDRF